VLHPILKPKLPGNNKKFQGFSRKRIKIQGTMPYDNRTNLAMTRFLPGDTDANRPVELKTLSFDLRIVSGINPGI